MRVSIVPKLELEQEELFSGALIKWEEQYLLKEPLSKDESRIFRGMGKTIKTIEENQVGF